MSKLDRLGRDAIDVGSTLKALAARNIEVGVLQLGNTALCSPAGKLMLTMLAAVAEMERDLLIERTQAGIAGAKAEGKTLGRPSETSEEQQEESRAAVATGGTSISELARRYSFSRAIILSIGREYIPQR